MGDLTAHFSMWEFSCRCGHPDCESAIVGLSGVLFTELEKLREWCDHPIHIISGIRCPHHKLTIQRPGSKHAKGQAADIVVVGMDPIETALLIEEQFPRFRGLGCNWRKGTVHVDTRSLEEEYCKWSYDFNNNPIYGPMIASLVPTPGGGPIPV